MVRLKWRNEDVGRRLSSSGMRQSKADRTPGNFVQIEQYIDQDNLMIDSLLHPQEILSRLFYR